MIVELATWGISTMIILWAIAVIRDVAHRVENLEKVVDQLVNIAEGEEDYSDLEDEEDPEDEEYLEDQEKLSTRRMGNRT